MEEKLFDSMSEYLLREGEREIEIERGKERETERDEEREREREGEKESVSEIDLVQDAKCVLLLVCELVGATELAE